MKDEELPFQTYERMFGRPWPGGCSDEIVALLRHYGIAYPPGSEAANLALQEKIMLDAQHGNRSSNEIAGPGARQFAELFHATYERLAPQFGYTTRTDTRRFDHGSENGKLMIAVCDYLLTWLDEKAPAEIERLTAELAEARTLVTVDQVRGYASEVEAKRLRAALELCLDERGISVEQFLAEIYSARAEGRALPVPHPLLAGVTDETTGEQK